MLKKTLLLGLMIFMIPTTQATMMRLDFTGTIIGDIPFTGGDPIGTYSGYFILDTSTPDLQTLEDAGRYEGALVDGLINWNGMEVELGGGDFGTAFVNNDSQGFNDLFAVVSKNSVDDAPFDIFFQLGDSTNSVFDSDEFPTALELALFDQLEIDNVSSTGVFILIGSDAFQATIDSINYRPVPLPGAVIFYLSALFLVPVFRKR